MCSEVETLGQTSLHPGSNQLANQACSSRTKDKTASKCLAFKILTCFSLSRVSVEADFWISTITMMLTVFSQRSQCCAVLLLSVLLSLLDVSLGGKKPPNAKDQAEISDQNNRGPKISSSPLVSIHRRNVPDEYNYVIMEWEKFEGSVPKDAVKYREDKEMYVCRNMEKKCSVGILKESKCEYEEAGTVKNPDSFEVLVNKDNFEKLKWKTVKCTREVEEVYDNAVKICDDQNLFIGRKNEEAKSLPVEKSASQQKYAHSSVGKLINSLRLVKYMEKKTGSCQVLIVSYENVMEQEISDYEEKEEKKEKTEVSKHKEQRVITNNQEYDVTETISSTEKMTAEERWDLTYSITAGVTVKMEAFESNLQFTTTNQKGKSITHEKDLTTSTQVTVEKKHKCTFNLVSKKIREETPFTAKLIRKFNRGDPKIRPISGTHVSIVGKAELEMKVCKPLNGNVDPAAKAG